MKTILSALLALFAWLAPAAAQDRAGTRAEVETQIRALDRVLFEEGFNQCRLDSLSSIIAEDLEFYHDLAGPSLGREAFMDAMRRNICAAREAEKPIRRLDEASLEIHPLYRNGAVYGAIQSGTHAFYLGRGKGGVPTSTARFTHLWIRHGETWQLSRALSYAHVAPEEG